MLIVFAERRRWGWRRKNCISSKLCGQQLKNEMDARLCIALHLQTYFLALMLPILLLYLISFCCVLCDRGLVDSESRMLLLLACYCYLLWTYGELVDAELLTCCHAELLMHHDSCMYEVCTLLLLDINIGEWWIGDCTLLVYCY